MIENLEIRSWKIYTWKLEGKNWKLEVSEKIVEGPRPRLKLLLQPWILRVILDLWESILDSRSLFRPLRFSFIHWEVISGPLGFNFWLRNVRPYNWVFKIGLWESVCLRLKNLNFSWIKSDWKNPIFLDEKNPMFFVNKIWLL